MPSKFLRLLLFCILTALPFGIWGITASGPTPLLDRIFSFLYGFVSGTFFTCVLFALSFIPGRIFQAIVIVFNILSYSTALFTTFYYLHFGYPFSSASLIVLLETNGQEAGEFITSISAARIVFFLFFFTLSHFFVFRWSRLLSKVVSDSHAKPRLVVLSTLAVIYGLCILKNDLLYQDSMFFALRDTYSNYQEEKELIAKQKSGQTAKKEDINISRDSIAGNETYILVLGESLSRSHMSLYGYQRETNPELEKLKDELLVFTDVVTTDNTTVRCLKKILTFATCDDMQALLEKPGLLQVLNSAGFDTYWISNQCYSGADDSWATLFSQDAKEKYHTNFVNSYKGTAVYDEAVLEPLHAVLKKPAQKKFIIVHLIGCHNRADFRYPVSYIKFNSYSDQPLTYEGAGLAQKRYVNSYDNSVLYNDHVVSEIIRSAKSLDQNSFVLYFPDHGEEVCERNDFSGHSDGMDSRYVAEVPMILWQSDDFRKHRTIDHSAVTRSFQTDDIIHSVLDLLQIKCDEFVKEKSIFDPGFIPKKRMVECRYDYDEVFGKKLVLGS